MKGLKEIYRRYGKNLEIIVYIGLFLLAWELASGSVISSVFLPPPSQIADYMFTSFVLSNLFSTVEIVVIGFFISIVLGLTIAFLIVYYPVLSRSVYPLLYSLKGVPATGLAILLVVWIGVGPLSKLLVVTDIAFFSILVNTVGGLESIEPETVEMMRSIRASRWQTFKKLRFPNALPQIVSGLKVAAPLTVVGAVVAEVFAGNTGLGYQVVKASSEMNMPLMFCALAWMGIVGTTLYGLILLAERLSSPWYRR